MGNIFTPDIVAKIGMNLPFFLPFSLGLIVLLIDKFWKDDDKDVLVFVGLAGFAASIFMFWKMWLGSAQVLFIVFPVSRFALSMVIILIVFALLFMVSTHQYFQTRAVSPGRLVALFSTLLFGLIISASTSALIPVFIGFVVSTASIFFMLKLYGKESKKIIISLVVADLIFLLGVLFFWGATGSLGAGRASEIIQTVNLAHTGNYFRIAIALFGVAFFIKLGLFPFHWWSLDVATLKHLPVINAILIFYRLGIIFIALKIFGPLATIWGGFFEWPIVAVAVLSMGWANVLMLRSLDIRDMIAHSSMAYIAYILALFPTLILKEPLAVSTIVFFAVAFTVSHFGFLVVTQILDQPESKHLKFNDFAGLGRSKPWNALLLSLFLLALAGVPPLIGFFARYMAVIELVKGGHYLLIVIVGINMAAALYSYTRLIARFYLFKPEVEEIQSSYEVGYPLIVAIAVAAIIVIYLGIFPSSFVNWIEFSIAGGQ